MHRARRGSLPFDAICAALYYFLTQRLTFTLLICVPLCGNAARAQSASAPPADSPPIRVNVRQVLVPVIVTDKKGHHVTGLKASDFRIEEDGVPQEIAAFSVDTAPSASTLLAAADVAARGASAQAPAPSAGPGGGGSPLGHMFVICIDTVHTAMPDSARIRQALLQLFQKEKPAGAQYVVIGIGRQLQVLRTATTDPEAILTSLKNPAFQPALGGGDAAELSSELNDLKNKMYDFCRHCTACALSSSTGKGSGVHACDGEVQNLKATLDAQSERWAAVDRIFLEQLKSVVEEISKLPVGRTLILVSDGFSLQPTAEFYSVAASFLPYESRFRLAGPVDLEPDLKSIIQEAVARNVRVYSVNSLGVQQTSFSSNGSMDASNPPDRSPPSVIGHGPTNTRGGVLYSDMDRSAGSLHFQNGSAMEQLARETGGVYFHDNNDMEKQFRSAISDGRDYYLLAYTPNNAAQDGRFRAITVRVNDKKLNVRAKAGYWAPAPVLQ